MNPSQYKPVLLKALTDGKKHRTAQALVDHIVMKMEAYEEAFALLAAEGGVLIKSEPGVETITYVSPIIPAGAPSPDVIAQIPIDIGSRVGVERQLTEEEIQSLKADTTLRLRQDLPPSFEVKPPGFTAPVKMLLGPITASPGAMPFLKFFYIPEGATSEASAVPYSLTLSPTTAPNVAKIVEEIKDMAGRMYSAQPRTVANHAVLNQGSLDSAQAIFTETDNENTPEGRARLDADRNEVGWPTVNWQEKLRST